MIPLITPQNDILLQCDHFPTNGVFRKGGMMGWLHGAGDYGMMVVVFYKS
jgi:hypothetical protein